MKKLVLAGVVTLGIVGLTGCGQTTKDSSGDRVSVGTVQKNIKVGMSSAEVASVLGSPNIVSTDEQRREVWIYDKVSQNVEYSKSGAFGNLLIIGGNNSSGSSSSSQKTLTIIIKFDDSSKVRDFAYHTSRF